LRIGFFTDSYLPVTHGVEVSIETFRKNLEKAGHKVFVYAPAVPGYADRNPRVFRLKSVRVIETPEMRLAFPIVEDGHIRNLTRFHLDIVHVHTPFTLGLLGRYIAGYQHVPMVYTHHTHYPEYAKAYFKERVVLPFLAKALSAWFANGCDAVIAPSPKIKTLLTAYGVQRPIHVLPTGIRLERFKRSRMCGKRARRLRSRLGIAEAAEVVLFVGRLGREKNVEFLIRAFAALTRIRRNVVFVLVGDGPITDQLQALASSLSPEKTVIFTGAVPHSNIAPYYQAADLFLFSSLTDTQGIVVLEAIGSGLPVVALRDAALTPMVKNGRNGYLLPPDASPALFARRVAGLLENQSVRRRFSGVCIRTAREFSEEAQARRLTELYEHLVARRS
jgi:glycosyltransferase involved in cell wall biosynthesis